MEIKHGNLVLKEGRGVEISLSGDELATAIDAYLVAHGICVRGPRTVRVNGEMCESARVFVDPSGFVNDNTNSVKYNGNGTIEF